MTRHEVEIGILGVGAIAEAIVIGLGSGYFDTHPVLLSPRNHARSSALAERYPSLAVAADNQDLVNRSDIVLVCLRPQDAGEILEGLDFTEGQQVISAVAALPLEQAQQWVAPATLLARVIPLPAVARREGLTAICPPDPYTRDLFARLGGSLDVDDEQTLDAMSAATATVAAHMSYLHAISQWLASRGLSEQEASRYVVATFAPLGETLRHAPTGLTQLAEEHATPGGLNEQFEQALRDAGLYELVRRSLDKVEARVRGD